MEMEINLGVVGAGGFAQFAVPEFVTIPGVRVALVYDANRSAAELLSASLPGSEVARSLEALVGDPRVDLVYIATPPYLHYPQSKAALQQGKHVICEKPAALCLEEAMELRELAAARDRLFVVNLMQRYNPLYEAVGRLIRERPLGAFLHGFFENYASDESLDEKHWFWDREKSGGIFIEHGVHFFDMFSGWLGEGRLLASQKLERPGHGGIWDRVQATVMYGDGLVNFYHGFDQPKLMDRQEIRLLFEKGEISLYEWVPTRMHLKALCTEEEVQALQQIFPGTWVNRVEEFTPARPVRGRFQIRKADCHIQMFTDQPIEKQALYRQLVESMLSDQLHWIKDRTHRRIIDQNNAVDSVRLAEKAEQQAACIYQEGLRESS